MTILYVLLGLWLVWVLGHAWLMFAIKPDFCCYTGFRIVIPDALRLRLTEEQYVAVFCHELGHMHHWHPWKNFLLVCIFRRASVELRRKQELEADDYAASIVGPSLLADALVACGATSAFDLLRVERLREMASKLVAQAAGSVA